MCGFDTCINTCSAGKLSHRTSIHSSNMVIHVDQTGNISIFLPPFEKGGGGDSTLAPEANSAGRCGFDTRTSMCSAGRLSHRIGLRFLNLYSSVNKVENISISLPPFQKGGRGDSALVPGVNSAGRFGFDTCTKNARCRDECGFDTCINTCSAGKLSHRIGLQLPSHLSCINKAGNIPGLPPPFVKGGRGDSTPAQKSCSPGRLP